MHSTLTRRGVLGAIGSAAVAGLATGSVAALQEDDDTPSAGDYWEVNLDEATTIREDATEDVRTQDDVVVARGVALEGGVEADGHVLVGNGAAIEGPIEATGGVVTGSIVDLGGVEAGDDALLGVEMVRAKQAHEAGELTTIGDLPIGLGALVEGDVTSGGDVVLGPDGAVEGSLEADPEATSLADESEDRQRPPRVVLGTWTDVAENVRAAGDAVIGSDSYVGRDVEAGGRVVFGSSVWVGGGITAGRIDRGPEADVFERSDAPEL